MSIGKVGDRLVNKNSMTLVKFNVSRVCDCDVLSIVSYGSGPQTNSELAPIYIQYHFYLTKKHF